MAERTDSPIYQLHIWIRQISPMIWRRILVRGESNLAQVHDVIQILFDWSDAHLHRFRIHGRDYGVTGGKLRSGARELARSFPHRTEMDRIASSYSAETLGQRKGRCQGLSVWSG
jgi:hypothetical protein